MITINSSDVKSINAALLSLQQGTTVYNNSTSTTTAAASSFTTTDTSKLVTMINANTKLIDSNSVRITSLESTIGEINTSISDLALQVSTNTGAISALQDSLTYWSGFLPYRFYESNRTVNLTNGYGETQTIDINSWLADYLPLTGGTLSGALTVNSDLSINGNIYQNGSAYDTHAEQVYTKDNLIILRDGAVAAMASGEYAGFEALLYDGTNNGYLVFDNSGTAYVGDEGSLQPLTTRDTASNMVDGKVVYWDSATSSLKTSSYAPGTTSGTLSLVTSNTYDAANIGTVSFSGASATKNIYQPNQALNTTSSPTFVTVKAALSGNATSATTATTATTASKVANALSIGRTVSSSTTYNGSAAASVYSPGQLLETTSSPTFSTVTAALSGNATSATTASKVTNSLTIGQALSSSTSYDGSAAASVYSPGQLLETTSSPTFVKVTAALDGNATSATAATKVSHVLTIGKAISSSTTYNGSTAASVYSPGQLLETTSSPTFSTVTAALNGNATSSSTASKVANGLTIGKTVSSSTTYNGSEAASVYSPGQLLETTSSPTFSTVTAALSGNATTASTASKVANALTIGRTVSSSTTYNGSNIASVYSPGQLLETTSSPTFSTVTASLTGNATSASTASKVANALTIAPTNTYTAVASTSYDGSAAKTSTIYTPNQNVNTTASPTFNTVTAALSGNATSATTASKVTNSLTIGQALSSSTSYDGSATASVYSPGQLLETTSSPVFYVAYLKNRIWSPISQISSTSSSTSTTTEVKLGTFIWAGDGTIEVRVSGYSIQDTLRITFCGGHSAVGPHVIAEKIGAVSTAYGIQWVKCYSSGTTYSSDVVITIGVKNYPANNFNVSLFNDYILYWTNALALSPDTSSLTLQETIDLSGYLRVISDNLTHVFGGTVNISKLIGHASLDLPLTGGLLTGSLSSTSSFVTGGNLYYSNGKYGLNMNNSDIIGCNSIIFGDSQDLGKGIVTVNSSSNYTAIRQLTNGAISIDKGTTLAGLANAFYLMGTKSLEGYYGMAGPSGDDTPFIRTTSNGLIPYKSGASGSGHCCLGTSSWYFNEAYIDDVYGTTFHGNATTATSATTASKVANALTIGRTVSSSTTYNGSTAASVYSPGQLLETTSSPTFNTVTAALSGNATSATTASKVTNALTIGKAISSSTSYNGSAAASIYSPGQLLETTSSPTFNALTVSTINGNMANWNGVSIPYVSGGSINFDDYTSAGAYCYNNDLNSSPMTLVNTPWATGSVDGGVSLLTLHNGGNYCTQIAAKYASRVLSVRASAYTSGITFTDWSTLANLEDAQTFTGVKTFTGGLIIPTTASSTTGAIWVA